MQALDCYSLKCLISWQISKNKKLLQINVAVFLGIYTMKLQKQVKMTKKAAPEGAASLTGRMSAIWTMQSPTAGTVSHGCDKGIWKTAGGSLTFAKGRI